MNAEEARLLTLQAKNLNIEEADILWFTAKEYIDKQIHAAAETGKANVKIDMKHPAINPHLPLKRVETELESDGFRVEIFLTRTPNGAREMIVEW